MDDQQRIDYAVPTADQHEALRAMARRCFADTFARHYDPEPFEAFLDGTYGPDGGMARDLADPHLHWFAAFEATRPIGYAKLTPLRAPAEAPLPGALELQQLYVLKAWHGTGVADRLMEWALATGAGAPEIYLTVFDHNERAKRFYGRYGFTEVGRCTFTLGDRVDDDRIWCRRP